MKRFNCKNCFNNRLNNYKSFSVKSTSFVVLFIILFNIIFSYSAVFATDATVNITITKVWENDNPADRPNDITVHLEKTSAKLITGSQLRSKMNTLATSSLKRILKATEAQYNAKRSSLTASKNEVQASDSNYKVYMWYETSNNAIYFYSEADNIYMNQNSASAFYNFTQLEDISGLAYFNTSYVTDMHAMFNRCYALKNISPLANWNVSNVTDMSTMFAGYYSSWPPNHMSIESIEPLRNWDVSNVVNMNSMFIYNKSANSFTSVEPLSGWNVQCVTNMGKIFDWTRVSDAATLSGWNVQSLKTYNMMFGNCPSLEDTPQSLPIFQNRAGTWTSDGSFSTSVPAQVISPHGVPAMGADAFQTQSNNWVKSGNTWTYTFTVNNDGSIYKTWEDATNLPSNYVSSAGSAADAIYVENNAATITNTNTRRYINITKQWNDDGDSSLRPANITLHLTKDGTTDFLVSNNNDWVKSGNTWTYVFEVSDNDNYSVWEDTVNGYTTNAPQCSPIAISNNSATIINDVNRYDITLLKKVTGNMAKVNKEFEYTITLYDRNNNLLTGNISIEKNGTPLQIVNGGTITLKHNDQLVISNVIEGYKYSITEADTDYIEHYKIENTNNSSVLVALNQGRTISNRPLNQNETVTFINDKEDVPATMASTYTGPFIITTMLSILLIVAVKNKKYLEDFIYKYI